MGTTIETVAAKVPELQPVRCGDCDTAAEVGPREYGAVMIDCPNCRDGATDAGPQNISTGKDRAEAAEVWNEEQLERLEMRAERLAQRLWGEAAWSNTRGAGCGAHCAVAWASIEDGDNRSVRSIMPNEDAALRVLIAGLEKALEVES